MSLTLSYKFSVNARDPIIPKSTVHIDSFEASFLTFDAFMAMNGDGKFGLEPTFKESLERYSKVDYVIDQETLSRMELLCYYSG